MCKINKKYVISSILFIYAELACKSHGRLFLYSWTYQIATWIHSHICLSNDRANWMSFFLFFPFLIFLFFYSRSRNFCFRLTRVQHGKIDKFSEIAYCNQIKLSAFYIFLSLTHFLRRFSLFIIGSLIAKRFSCMLSLELSINDSKLL